MKLSEDCLPPKPMDSSFFANSLNVSNLSSVRDGRDLCEDGGEANLISYNTAISACGKGRWAAVQAVHAGPDGGPERSRWSRDPMNMGGPKMDGL